MSIKSKRAELAFRPSRTRRPCSADLLHCAVVVREDCAQEVAEKDGDHVDGRRQENHPDNSLLEVGQQSDALGLLEESVSRHDQADGRRCQVQENPGHGPARLQGTQYQLNAEVDEHDACVEEPSAIAVFHGRLQRAIDGQPGECPHREGGERDDELNAFPHRTYQVFHQ